MLLALVTCIWFIKSKLNLSFGGMFSTLHDKGYTEIFMTDWLKGNYFIKLTKDIETVTLDEILDNYLPKNQQIDFLSIDVEGHDFIVLKSINLEKYRPKVILIEILGSSLSEINNNEISKYLINYGYSVYAKAINTVFFIDDNFFNKLAVKTTK